MEILAELSEVILNTTSPYVFANKKDQNSFEKLSKETKSTRLGGDCYSYCLLADGHVDIVVESGLKPWDIRALEPIITNPGCLMVIDNVAMHMPADGSVWVTNNTKYHNAFNGGEENRIHLVACVLDYKFN